MCNHLAVITLLLVCLSSCKKEEVKENAFLSQYQVESGFELELVAMEPMIVAPVAMDFDNRGRMWITELTGYMSHLEGDATTAEGKIKILEDTNGDGLVDTAKVFLDKLNLPRALALVYGGLLYAEPPNLWFVCIEGDSPGDRVLVDSLYAVEGNIEHQPNGLIMNLDNWIYNAKSNYRYRKLQGNWIKEPTSFRGQWGITHDDYGRLYYNNNSVQLMGDLVLPNSYLANPYLIPKHAVNQVLTSDQRVYPLRASSVNRGYLPGVLNEDSMLVNVTAACGPLIYRGGQFPETHYQNAFVCIPEANLIKRNVLTFDGVNTSARQADIGKEFLASYDEGFRPVNLNNGPDGALYVVDMHRGIIAHKAYTTPYMRHQIQSKQLDTLQNLGRILRVKARNRPVSEIPNLLAINSVELVAQLDNSNGWTRERAQQLIIEQQDPQVLPLLNELVEEATSTRSVLHALYALEGLQALTLPLLLKSITHEDPMVVVHSLMLLKPWANEANRHAIGTMLQTLTRQDPQVDLYLAPALKPWLPWLSDSVFNILRSRYAQYSHPIFREALLNFYINKEEEILSDIVSPEDSLVVLTTLQNRELDRKNPVLIKSGVTEDPRTKGWKLFRTTCATCHGMDGNGLEGLAPPLMNSEYVRGSSTRLGLILLHGLEGPIRVAGKDYEFNNPMPGLTDNQDISNRDLVDIIAYIRSAFVTTSESITEEEIQALRSKLPPTGRLYQSADFKE